MSDRVWFFTKTETVNTDGGQSSTMPSTFLDADAVRAKVRYAMTHENESVAKQEKFTTEIKVWTRYNSNIGEMHWVNWNSLYYEIFSIETTPGNRYHVIKARLITT